MTSPDTLYLERVVTAPRAQVWETWTTDQGLASWWWSHFQDTTYAVDLRPGGSYRIETAWTTTEPSENYAMGWNFTPDQLQATSAGSSAPGSPA